MNFLIFEENFIFFFISECYVDLRGWKPVGWVKPGRLTVWLASAAAEGSVCTCLFCCLNSHALGSAGSNSMRNVRDEKRRDQMFLMILAKFFSLPHVISLSGYKRSKAEENFFLYNGTNVFCFLSSLTLLPPATTAVYGFFLSSLYC